MAAASAAITELRQSSTAGTFVVVITAASSKDFDSASTAMFRRVRRTD